MKLSEFFPLFLQIKSQEVSLSTIEKYKQAIDRFISLIGDKEMKDYTFLDIERYKFMEAQRGVKTTTINIWLRHIKAVFNYALQTGEMENKIIIKQFRVIERPVREIPKSTITKLLNAASEDFRDLLIVAFNTGMRRGELYSLKCENVDFEKGIIILYPHQTKVKRVRYIPVSDRVLEILAKYCLHKRKNQRVFHFLLSPNSITNRFKKLKNKVKIKNVRFHDIRHTFAIALIKEGFDISEIQQILGHSTIVTTKKYLRFREDYLREKLRNLKIV
jgi:integrase